MYKRIKETRILKNISQEQIAEKLGMCQQQYSRYETGQREIPAKQLREIALYFNVSSDYLLELK